MTDQTQNVTRIAKNIIALLTISKFTGDYAHTVAESIDFLKLLIEGSNESEKTQASNSDIPTENTSGVGSSPV